MMQNKQLKKIADYLLTGRGITTYQAIAKYGCTRLPAKIYTLRNYYSYNIKKVMVNVVNRYGDSVQVAKYFMLPEDIKAITGKEPRIVKVISRLQRLFNTK